jgi:hypothetical protein
LGDRGSRIIKTLEIDKSVNFVGFGEAFYVSALMPHTRCTKLLVIPV